MTMKTITTVYKPIQIFFAAAAAILFIYPMALGQEAPTGSSAVSVGKLLSNAEQYSDTVVVQGYVKEVLAEDGRIKLSDPHHPHMGAHGSCAEKGYHSQNNHLERKGDECPKYAGKNDADDKISKCPVTGKKCEMPCKETCNQSMAKACKKSGISQSLTVNWKGDMPEVSVPVSVTGKLVQKNGELIFEATSVNVLN